MINLVKYRYLFMIISLVVLIPGTISLIFFQLKVGIDFAGGSDILLRPQKEIKTTEEIYTLLAPLNLDELQVIQGENQTISGPGTVWVRLNTWVDSDVQRYITDELTKKYPGLDVVSATIPVAGGKNYTLVTLTKFEATPKVEDIKSVLSKIPNTSDPGKSALAPSTTSTPAATSTPQATGTPTAGATPTPQATSTPTAGATPTPAATATPTPAANPNATIPVKVDEVIQGTTTQTITLRIGAESKIQSKDVPNIQGEFLKNNIYTQLIYSSEVGPSVAGDTTRNAVFAVLAAAAFILLYIWFAFRKVEKAWRYGTCAIVSLLHDALVVLGVFSIFGVLFDIQVDALFITALLTVIGFSVHDTIVVFDRIRENMRHRSTETFEQIVNASLVQTMARSINTSLTVLFTLLALTLFGSSTSVHTFTLTLLIGIASGTYSSIFTASMMLVMWEKGEMGLGYFSRKRGNGGDIAGKRKQETRELARSRG